MKFLVEKNRMNAHDFTQKVAKASLASVIVAYSGTQ
jgi:hypothetical protein